VEIQEESSYTAYGSEMESDLVVIIMQEAIILRLVHEYWMASCFDAGAGLAAANVQAGKGP
jgi:hypothetical protein